ncbi:N-acetylglutamate kinase [Sporobacter termitidis DSM 10068]|uniref:Acetylglutamate kinase n=1 Tax=Sporobacter termitidis DSM 10068 TaxID=1123282 RepID=A0A1M5Y272_9FIRM|nr:acetylglutamate kinase [Sporobacter termitidis]SHI05894.1 N-acetylglutamate kinase [Sporobacter termitidis DSM 10068]
MNNLERAQTLVEALPYIQQYYGKVVVIKYGGNAMISPELFDAVMEDIILLHLVGIHVVLVHGGGPEINDMLGKIGKEPKFVRGLRYTDEETMTVVQGVLCGKVNKDLVATIIRKGGRAIGLCGIDGCLIEARRMRRDDGEDYGLVGDITTINPSVVQKAMEDNLIPVVATVAIGIDADTSYNVNADTAASRLAVSLGAEKLIILTDTRGVLRDPKDDATLIKVIKRGEIQALSDAGVISGGMIPKIECCAGAIDGGVKRTHILDGRIPHSILIEMLTDEGAGTMIF